MRPLEITRKLKTGRSTADEYGPITLGTVRATKGKNRILISDWATISERNP